MGGRGGKGNRHYKGNNRSADKERRKAKADAWKNTRGDERTGDRGGSWPESDLDNARFQAFYLAQRFVGEGAEWGQFLTSLRTPLPACFRIYSDYAFAGELSRELMGFCGDAIEIDDKLSIQAVEQLAWYPNGCAYKLGTDKRNIRKVPRLEGLHKWLKKHTESGNITRQEAVSMVPPLALDVAPHHRCLDMCAAPGSKTSQLLEVINRSAHDFTGEQGLVVANDPDIDRAYMLVHQCRRISSPLLLIATHRGEQFPLPYRNAPGGGGEFFDRVLCDVPCSGDGTMRKNPMIWQKWSTSSAYTLHPLQLSIAKRGLQLLKTGGLMVYSTCSMSPYEDEAVVAELLRSSKGKLELVDARQFLPKLKTRPGLSHWAVLDDADALRKARSSAREGKQQQRQQRRQEQQQQQQQQKATNESKVGDDVAGATVDVAADSNGDAVADSEAGDSAAPAMPPSDPSTTAPMEEETPSGETQQRTIHTDPLIQACLDMGMNLYDSHDQVPEEAYYVRKSCFPPSEEEKQWMHLERCLRCVPHDEDSGGFFVATFRKVVAPSGSAQETEEDKERAVDHSSKKQKVSDDITAVTAAKPEQERERVHEGEVKPTGKGAGMVQYESFDAADFAKLQEFYGFDERLTAASMYTRKDLSVAGPSSGGAGAKSVYWLPRPIRDLMGVCELKIVSCGMKVFERHNSSEYRLVQEGVSSIGPFITKRIVEVGCQDFCNFLEGGLVSFSTLSTAAVEALSATEVGVIICVYKFSSADVLPDTDLSLAVADATDSGTASAAAASSGQSGLMVAPIYAICYRSKARALNIMCNKKEVEVMRHQLSSLRVLRPKIASSTVANLKTSALTDLGELAGAQPTSSSSAMEGEGAGDAEEQDGEGGGMEDGSMGEGEGEGEGESEGDDQ